MRLESEDLYEALWQIGSGESDELIRPEILDRLAELKIIEILPDGKPTLTKFGARYYVRMESGDCDLPEFE
jgi:hypothetical protein